MEIVCEACNGTFEGDPIKHKYKKPKYCSMCRDIKRNNWASGRRRTNNVTIPEEFKDLGDDTGIPEVDDDELW